jgi:aspartyl-tRNA(Asn)/glutamyl-tRNA(Gln) amidotransferase subunit B
LLNGEAVHKAVQFCCAINADIAAASYFVRIYGFSPQSPYNFHISQRHHPLACGGAIGFKVDGEIFTVAISHLFLEEDNAVVINRASYSTVDYNRAGRPLLVIVAATPLPTAQAATAYCMAVGQLARSLGISDCSLEEGACGIDGHMSEGMPLYYNLPEPDLQPIVLSRSYIDAMHKSVAEQLGHR